MNITPVTKPFAVSGLAGITGAGMPGVSFADVFGSAVKEVESSQQSAKSAAMDLLAGGQGDVHTVALASQRAELSLELFQQVRNKFVSAYQEIMKMPM
jgi:flagellar hook-basal body complex protein FliE